MDRQQSNKRNGWRAGAALGMSLLAVWRLPYVLEVGGASLSFAYVARSIVLVCLFAALLFYAFGHTNRKTQRIAYGLGLLFSFFAVAGRQLTKVGSFPPITVGGVLRGVGAVIIFAVLLGAIITLLYDGALRLAARMDAKREDGKAESRFSRLLGNGWLVFAFILLCWIPVWLAFWPGTFRYDAPTQFSEYTDQWLSAHHPLVHTLLLGRLLDIGLEMDSMAIGIALYCGLQMLLMAGILGYACHWLWRRGVPTAARLCVVAWFALMPLFPLWSFNVTKDVLFGGLVLLTALQLMDVWRDGFAALRSLWRVALFVATCVLMMLLRNNGVYAFALALPFGVVAAKGGRLRMALVCVGTIGVYLLCNAWLIQAVDAEQGSSIEMLSVPLQQMAHVTAKSPDTISEEDWEIIDELYAGADIAVLYDLQFADPNKWLVDVDAFESEPERYLGLWLRLGVQHPGIYTEAFLGQNRLYYYPFAPMRYNILTGQDEMEFYPIEAEPILPALGEPYQRYEETLSLLSIPGSELLSNTAFMVWLCLLCLGLAMYRRQYGMAMACVFLLAIWVTNLLGPVAIMRYMLGFFYCMPVLLAGIWARPKDMASVIVKEG